jgi:secondary thiamine-phosphate synthase enzyme
MKQTRHCLSLSPRDQGLYEVTGDVAGWLAEQPVRDGMLTVFIRHTSASILIQENADPNVRRDLEAFFANLVPEDAKLYRHTQEGPDDMSAHIKGALTQSHLSIPVEGGRMMLGPWQGIFIFEHRRVPRTREIILHLIGD